MHSSRKGIHHGPDLVALCVEPITRVVVASIVTVMLATAAMAGVEDGPDATATGGGAKRGLTKLTEDPSPIGNAVGDLYIYEIDLRPWTQFGRPLFTNPEAALPMPSVIVPRDYGLRIITPDPVEVESQCSERQNTKCSTLCGQKQKLMVSCDVSFQWQPDGSCVRTLTCTCASPAQMWQVASSARAETVEFTVDDTRE